MVLVEEGIRYMPVYFAAEGIAVDRIVAAAVKDGPFPVPARWVAECVGRSADGGFLRRLRETLADWKWSLDSNPNMQHYLFV